METTTPGNSDTFYASIPVFHGFGSLMDPAWYSPLPDDWTIGVADIVESTKAIAYPKYGRRSGSPPVRHALSQEGLAGIASWNDYWRNRTEA